MTNIYQTFTYSTVSTSVKSIINSFLWINVQNVTFFVNFIGTQRNIFEIECFSSDELFSELDFHVGPGFIAFFQLHYFKTSS